MECILSSESLSRMALTSVPLRILDLSAMRMPASILRRIATHLPTIEILRVKFFPDWLDVSRPYFHLFSYRGSRGIKFLLKFDSFLGGGLFLVQEAKLVRPITHGDERSGKGQSARALLRLAF
jgi:hypothetical protein